jgi:hypothetical protein
LRGIEEGDGLRIVRQTLALQYPSRHSVTLESTQDGWTVSIQLPRRAIRESA